MKIAFYTLGCKVNNAETEGIIRQFVSNGWEVVSFNEAADVYVVNSCAVTSLAEAKSRKAVAAVRRRMVDDGKKPIIAVMGCASEIGESKFKADIVLGTKDRDKLYDRVVEIVGADLCVCPRASTQARPYERTRKIIKIQDGCENYCAYCIIPLARGKEKSRDISEVLDEIREKPASEVVLVGIHVSSWQMIDDRGQKLDLIDLVKEVSKIEGVHRVRLGSLEPHDLDEGFIEKAAELCAESRWVASSQAPRNDGGKLCPHFHISLQSGSDSVLRRMGRKYSFEDFYKIVKSLKEKIPNCAITTDVIVGFGGETLAEFEESLANIERCGFSKIHVFPYSEREGTAGASEEFLAEFGSVPKDERKRRAKILGELAEQVHKEFLEAQMGQVAEIVWEKNGGYTPNYARVIVDGDFVSGEIVRVKIVESDGERCFGEVIKE